MLISELGIDTGVDGKSWKKAFKTYSRAITECTTNNNDVIHINGVTEVV